MESTKRQSRIIVRLFAGLILAFALLSVFWPKRARSEAENRTLQQLPGLTWDSLISGEFAKDYESYLSDQFPLRDQWITLKTGIERASLKKDSKGVYFAKDGYLIESHDGVFTAEQADKNIGYLAAFMEKMQQTLPEGHVTAMIVPNAVDILRDKLPAFASPYDEETYLAGVEAALPEGTYMNVSEVLREAAKNAGDSDTKNSGDEDPVQLYYRTDHHWTTVSAFLAFREWAKDCGLGDVSVAEYKRETVTDSFEGTISSKLGISGRADSIERFEKIDVDCSAVPLAGGSPALEGSSDASVNAADGGFESSGDIAPGAAYALEYNQDGKERYSLYWPEKLETKDKYAYFYGGNFGLIEGRTAGSNSGRRLLVIKDSYAHCFVPFTYRFFDEVDMVDPRYFNQSLSSFIESKNYTDVLFLFNAAGFAEETSLARLLT